MFATPLPQHATRLQVLAPVRCYRLTGITQRIIEQNHRLDWQREAAITARRLEDCRLAMQAAGYAVVETPFI